MQLSHAIIGTRDFLLQDRENAAGGHSGSLALTRESPNKARQNAENFAYYALAAYFGPGARISLDPNNLVIQGGHTDLLRRRGDME